MTDTSNIPGCFPLLGGVQITAPMNTMQYGTRVNTKSKNVEFQQINLYINPAFYIMGALTDSSCLDTRGFDSPYVSFADPTHGDDTLVALLEPHAFAFANLPAALIGTLDAIQVNAGMFGNKYIPWWFGSWGSAFPHTGSTPFPASHDDNGRLLTAKLFDKLHNMGVMNTAAGDGAMCGYVPQLQMDKRQYKFSRLLPFPEQKTLGTCCAPIGRTTILSGVGVNAPLPGYNNMGYFIFRKRDCCSGIISPSSAAP
jgi:conjugal transfer pilus assembly protein TraU